MAFLRGCMILTLVAGTTALNIEEETALRAARDIVDRLTRQDSLASGSGDDVEPAQPAAPGRGSIKVEGDDVVITTAGTVRFAGEGTSVAKMLMDIKAGDARVQTNLETNLGAAEIKTNASIAEAIDVLDSSLQEYKVEVEGEFDKAKTASERYVDDIVSPAIAAVESNIDALETKVTVNLAAQISTIAAQIQSVEDSAMTDADVLKLVDPLKASLLGINQPFAADNCAAIMKARSTVLDGIYWIKSSGSVKEIRVWCQKVGNAFVSMGGDGSTKEQAAAGCFAHALIMTWGETGTNAGTSFTPWIDPDANAESPSNAKQLNCGDGMSKATAGLTCKGIKLSGKAKTGRDANGLRYFIGRNQEYKASPKRAYCWNSDRDGGGWTLVLVMYYRSHQQPRLSGTGQITTGDINRGDHWLTHLPGAYKMHDHEIRSVIGQPQHTNDAANGPKSMFSYMMDQSGWNNYYAEYNREYAIHKQYTARWRFYRFQVIPASTTKSRLTMYRWDVYNSLRTRHTHGSARGYRGDNRPMGDGEINWTGEPICARGGAGVNCRGHKDGKPHNSIQGGRGCHVNIGRDRWHGDSHLYMMNTNHDTYMYMCNGPQHSSGNRFASRVWMRTPDDDLVA